MTTAADHFRRLICVTLLTALPIGAAWAQKVRLATTEGDMVLELDRARAPQTVDNFIAYVRSGHFDGTIFHRVIPGFMIQGGGFTPDMTQKPTRPPIPLESRNGVSNARGTLAMARTVLPNSATAQFFINARDNDFLDAAKSRDGNGYAVFGKVAAGMDVLDKIQNVPTGTKGPHQNVPNTPVIITKATLEN